jgi:3-phenylpropionate/cinnamic acid dioxygenase small subunit
MSMVMSALDYEEIRQLLARYNFAIDLGDAEGWAACFTEDGVFHCTPEGGPLTGRHVGEDALVASSPRPVELNRGRARHWNWNLDIDGDGRTATMRCYLAALSATGADDPAALRITGVYRDRLVKLDDGWRFAERHVHLDPQSLAA